MTPFWFFLLTLATYRLVRLALYDTITETPRTWFMLKFGGASGWRSQVAYLLTCQWCLGVHAALWATVAWSIYDGWPGAVPFVAVWFALAGGQSFVHLIEDLITSATD